MTDPSFPRWPSTWLEDHGLAAEEVLAAAGDVELLGALRADGHVLFSVTWSGGRRYMLVDPIGNDAPAALRAGAKSTDGETARVVEGVWSQALTIAKGLIDGETELPPELGGPPPKAKRPWRR